MKNRYIIIIFGHSCSGKSTTIKELQKKLKGSYHIGYDRVKRGLAGYDRNTDREVVCTILDGFIRSLIDISQEIIVDGLFRDKDSYERLISYAIDRDYSVISVHLDCPLDIRLERFRERIQRGKLDPNIPLTVTDESLFLENAQKPISIPEDCLTFDTSVLDTQGIVRTILMELS